MDISHSQKNRVLNVWIVSDNKPGHYNQTEGLVQAISQYRDVKLERMPLVSRTNSIKMLFFSSCHGTEQYSKNKPDVIIGAGHKTHMSLLAYRRCFGGRAVVMMSPSLPLGLFDLCFIPRHDQPKKVDNVVQTLGAINRVIPSKNQHENKGLILLGGPSKHFKWDSEKVLEQIKTLVNRQKSIDWKIAGSRRTPSDCYEKIKAKLPELPVILPEDVSREWLPDTIGQSGQVWVTEDSVSMVYESLTSGAKTGLLRLLTEKPTRVTEEIDRLLIEGSLLAEGSIRTISSGSEKKMQAVIYEADRCAKLLLKKFGL